MAHLYCLPEANQCWIWIYLFEHLLRRLKWSQLEVLSESLFHPRSRSHFLCRLVCLFELCRMHLTGDVNGYVLYLFWQLSICVPISAHGSDISLYVVSGLFVLLTFFLFLDHLYFWSFLFFCNQLGIPRHFLIMDFNKAHL